jgi:hypothetical protein
MKEANPTQTPAIDPGVGETEAAETSSLRAGEIKPEKS